MNQNSKISIIMPAYNSEKYIAQSIMSVVNQTYIDWELLIINDGSTDSTAEIANRFINSDNRIRLLTMPRNSGVAATRNYGVSCAVGEWIAFLDSDDIWDKMKLEKQINDLRAREGSFSFTGSAFIDSDGRQKKGTLRVPAKINYKQLLKQNVISCSSVLITRTLMIKYPMVSGDLHEDFATWLEILKDQVTAYGVNEPLLLYRITATSKSGNKIKAAKMTYHVYRYLRLSLVTSIYYMIFYTFRSIKKYLTLS